MVTQRQDNAMRIFVFEYVTGGGLTGKPMISELAHEGDMMLQALIGELLNIPGVQVTTTRDARLANLDLGVTVCPVSSRDELLRVWSSEVSNAEAVWPIAPETDGILEFLTSWVELAGRTLLTSRPHAVRIAASKSATIRRLEEQGLPVVPTWRAGVPPPPGNDNWVLKPDHGVGCVGSRLIRGRQNLTDAVAELPNFEDWVVQPYLPGHSASLSLLVDGNDVELLGCNLQRIVLSNDRFLLLGCEINGLSGDRGRFAQLGQDVVRGLPGLWGYVGVDLLMVGEEPIVLEVNPRLTTSYVGLGSSLGENVAAMVLGLVQGIGCTPDARRRPKRVEVDLEHFCTT